jgi:pimeloyl-ACP methyl ester carboxylesterase
MNMNSHSHIDEGQMEHKLNIHEAETYVREVGQGVPLLLLHGSPDSADMWNPVVQRFGSTVRSFAVDLPGFGRSTLPSEFTLTLEHYAEFINELLTALKIDEPVNLLNTDFGTHYALAFLVKHPERVKGVVISNSAFHQEYQWHRFAQLYRLPLVGEFLMAGSSKRTIAKALKGYAPALPASYIESSYGSGFGSPKVRKTILRMYRERNPTDFVGWDEKSRALLAQTPSMVLWGDLDPFADKGFADKFGAQQVHHFTNYSHWLPLEAPDAYVEKVKKWMST